ncbi:unnamed protein product [Brassica oleracea]|uniref:DDE Tnp4 domain-containing protein n=1 Tax=Brassica oleracea TaxID=3712 RepID=A0A3P6DS65_BRAOL|nr:unnamed protein product [Brassica oleracea]
MDRMAVDYVRPRTALELTAISNRFQRDAKYGTYFHGFVGIASLNVLAICDYDMLFTYCYVGMGGSAHDARVLATAIRDDPMFPVPPENKYYLVDSGYANRRGYLAPFRKEFGESTRYHLQEFNNGQPPRTSKEIF